MMGRAVAPDPPFGGTAAPALSEAAYFHVRSDGERQRADGAPRCFFGHQVDGSPTSQADGVFASWSWDGRRLEVRNDRYGYYPLYYFRRGGEFAISPSIPVLVRLGAPREIDAAGLAVFLRLGFFVGEDTPFGSIRAVPPAATLVWEAGRLRVSGGFTLSPPANLSRSAALDGYISTFREAIRRREASGDDFAVPLSGGQDSRHILLELCALGRRPRFCVTFAPWGAASSPDVEVAAQVAGALGVKHVVVQQPASRLRSELRKNLATSFCTDEHAQYVVLAEYLRGRVGTLYDGASGDVLSAGASLDQERWIGLMEAGRFEELARDMLGRSEQFMWVVRADQRARLSFDLAVERLARELSRHAEAPSPLSSFRFWNRHRREIALYRSAMYAGIKTVFAPYLDRGVYDLLSSLPTSMLADGAFHRDAIRRAHPKLADIPFAGTRRTPLRCSYVRRSYRELMAYIAAEPTELVSRPAALAHATTRFLRALASAQTVQQSARLIYLLQLDRFIRSGHA